MLKRMLRVYHTLGFVLSVEMMHYDTSYWTLTFDEATYSSPTRKIIYFIQVSACFDSGQFDSMDLPDFGIGILSVEWWHLEYTLLKHLTFGPAVPKCAGDDDNKRFTYTNFTRTMLVIQRERGVLEDELSQSLQAIHASKPTTSA